MRDAITRVIDAAFPPACPSCNKLPGPSPTYLCSPCQRIVEPITTARCAKCGMPFPHGTRHELLPHRCDNCTGIRLHFKFATAGYLHKGAIRYAIHRLKYRHSGALASPLAHLFLKTMEDPRIAEAGHPWLLVPAPIHPRRKIDRGYNQAAEICHRLGKLTGIPSYDILRIRGSGSAQHQMELTRKERLTALKDTIALRVPPFAKFILKGKHILFIDDILTTGATASVCAQVLTQHGGAQTVAVATLARS